MDETKLRQVLTLHGKWLDGDGVKANLRYADLSDANLRYANLRYADLGYANLRYADLRGADLSGADLSDANLSDANLRGADLDFASWPLWHGSLDVKIDKRLFVQLAYHLCRLVCDDPECIDAQNSLIDIANQFHRVDECGEITLREVR